MYFAFIYHLHPFTRSHLQRLTYFDDLDLDDKKKLSFYHVVPNSIIRVKWWTEWDGLIRAAYYGDVRGKRYDHVGKCNFLAGIPSIDWTPHVDSLETAYFSFNYI